MESIRLAGRITEKGELKVALPKGLPAGEVQVVIEVPGGAQGSADQSWTKEELRELLRSEPRTAAEIADSDAVGGWEYLGITDSVAWVEEVRRREQGDRGW